MIWSILLPWDLQAEHASWQNDTMPLVSSLINQSQMEKGDWECFIMAETGNARIYQSCVIKVGNPTDLSACLWGNTDVWAPAQNVWEADGVFVREDVQSFRRN